VITFQSDIDGVAAFMRLSCLPVFCSLIWLLAEVRALRLPHSQKESFYCVNVYDADQMNGVMWLYM